MTTSAPYSGSLMRLALTTVAVMAVLAAAVSFWQGALGKAVRAAAPSHPALSAPAR